MHFINFALIINIISHRNKSSNNSLTHTIFLALYLSTVSKSGVLAIISETLAVSCKQKSLMQILALGPHHQPSTQGEISFSRGAQLLM